MCKNPINIHTMKFMELLKVVERRLESHNQKLTKSKTAILEVLYGDKSHLSVEDIISLTKKKDKKLTVATVYRILSSFEAYGIVESLSVDDRKLYELVYTKQPHYHLYCIECNKIMEFESIEIHEKFLSELLKQEFTPTSFNVIINGVCKKCQK